MTPKNGEAKNDFLKRCTIGKIKDSGMSNESAFSMCNRFWDGTNNTHSSDGMLTFSDVMDFGSLVEIAMAKDKMTVNEACESVRRRYPESYAKYERELKGQAENYADQELAEKALELAEKENIDISEATERILEQDTDLARQYNELYQ